MGNISKISWFSKHVPLICRVFLSVATIENVASTTGNAMISAVTVVVALTCQSFAKDLQKE